MVAGVNPDGPADQAHLRNGDVILQFNGQDVKDMRALPRMWLIRRSASRSRWWSGATGSKSR